MDFSSIIGFFGFLTYATTMIAYLMRNILYLRLFSIASCLSAMVYFSFYTAEPLWINLFWEGLIAFVNVIQIAILIYNRRRLKNLNDEERQIYEKVFPHFPSEQLRKLLQISKRVTTEEGTQLTKQGEPVLELALICKGSASVTVDNIVVANCKSGDLIGEMSFISKEPASATVEFLEPSLYITWRHGDLHRLIEKNPEMDSSLRTVFNATLVAKLARSTKEHTSESES